VCSRTFRDWVPRIEEPKTEIKFIEDRYYKYQIHYKYNSKKKITDKITGLLVRKITEKGFLPADKTN